MINRKSFIVLLSFLCLNSLFAQTISAATPSPTATLQPEKTGGWYPVFFEIYDQAKVDSIINTIQQNHARRIVVLYDKNFVLANKIISSIQAKANFAVERSQDVPQDTATTKYNHRQVVVTVFLKDSNGKTR